MRGKITSVLLTMLFVPLAMMAQNVTIGPNNGSLITGQAGGNTGDSGIGRGMSALWRHEQLPLSVTTSDIANLTSAGELADPSCALDVYKDKLIIGAGQTQTFMVVSLPKGYRITGYRLVLQPDISGTITLHTGKSSWSIGTDDQMSFYETPAWGSGSPYGDNTRDTRLTCDDAIATAKDADGNTVMKNSSNTERAKEYVIERTSTDMTNQLYFFFARSSQQYAVSINSFELYYTAEGTFEAEVTPVTLSDAGDPTSYVTTPFSTSKMDIGVISVKDQMYTYDYTGVRDIKANMHLYQWDAVSGGKPANVSANKHIYPLKIDGNGAFGFGNDTYFVEPPTEVYTVSGDAAPIGFRVVGATFEYKYGEKIEPTTVTIPAGIYVTCSVTTTSGGGGHGGGGQQTTTTTYYLNANLDFIEPDRDNPATVWHEDEYGNIYIGDEEYRQYLACFGSSDEERILSLSTAATGSEAKWNLRIDDSNHLYYEDSHENTFVLYVKSITEGKDDHYRGYVKVGQTSSLATAQSTGGDVTKEIPGFNPGVYTLTVFKNDGTTPAFTKTVKSGDKGTFEMNDLNNDAVKFQISGLGNEEQALVNITLKLQALNPYINSMNIVCKGLQDELQMKQTFTASDFRVSGGQFVFYVPDQYKGQQMQLEFADLYSSYGDETYPDGGNGNARYSFVSSEYFEKHKDIYADPTGVAESDYKTKVVASKAGNIRFKFNNAEDLTASGTNDRYLVEYPFSYDTYVGSADPDGNTGKTGAFEECKVTVLEQEDPQKFGTFYLFTADEPRYNIATTTALQHRSYAFYRMDIEVIAKTFTPEFEWEKVYDNSCYTNDDGKTDLQKSMWGLKLKTTETVDGHQGFMTISQLQDGINNRTKDDEAAPIDDEQILYIDASDLLSLVETSEQTIDQVEGKLGKNLLVFLPKGTTSTRNNIAYKTSSDSFRAGGDIVLTDRQPFYSPYDIQVDAANYATYTREITVDANGKVANATVMLPFQMSVSGGTHTNDANAPGPGDAFTVNELQSGQSMATQEGSSVNYGTAYFAPISAAKTAANRPYMIHVKTDKTAKETISFIASEMGAGISATKTAVVNEGSTGLFYTGENNVSAKVTLNDETSSYYFTNKGTYSGGVFDRAESEDVFYFANDKYLNLHTLAKSAGQYFYLYPFRAAYTYSTTTSAAKQMKGFYIDFDGLSDGNPTSIETPAAQADLMIRAGKGMLSLMASRAQNVAIYTLSGIGMERVQLNAGDAKTVALPAGVYIVNGTKIVVK